MPHKSDTGGLTIGVLSPYLSGYYFGALLTELHRNAFASNVQLLSVRAGRRQPISLPLSIDLVDGWIVVLECVSAELLDSLVASGKPVVSIGHNFQRPDVMSVESDNRQAIGHAVDYLVAAGHRWIACVGKFDEHDIQQRLIGFRSALARHGLPSSPALELHTDGYGYAAGRHVVGKLLAGTERFTAVLACTDLIAAGVVDALQESGLRVPEDVAVIGYDNMPLTRTIHPALASIDQNMPRLTQTALESVCEQARFGKRQGGLVLVENAFIPRASCSHSLSEASSCLEPPQQQMSADEHANDLSIGYEVTKDLISADFAKVLERMWVLAPYLEWACIGAWDDFGESVDHLRIDDVIDLQTPDSRRLLDKSVPIAAFPPLDHLPQVPCKERFATVVPILFNSRWTVLAVTACHRTEAEIARYATLMHYIDLLSVALERSLLDEDNRRRENNIRELADELDRTNRSLEERVRSRTRSLEEKNQELSALNARLSQAQEQLVQSEKLASIGQLAAGVAHEINNPIGFIHSNFGSLKRYLDQVFAVVEAFEAAETTLTDEHVREKLRATREAMELDFLKTDIPELMDECQEGLARVRKIVQDLKDFSHVDQASEWQWADIHRGIDSTLNIINSEIKYRADIVKEYGDIPEIECLPSELNQVIMNLVINASHAMEARRGTITLRTGRDGDHVWIEVEDQGCGISKENMQRIFDPFFTTKPVGKGTGLGLSLSYGIVQRHGGNISVRSVMGQGSTFRIVLPIARAEHTSSLTSTSDHRQSVPNT